jgi:hypothetical protein
MARARNRRNAAGGGGRAGGGGGGGFGAPDMHEALMREIFEMMQRARADEDYRNRRRARYRAGPGDFFVAMLTAVLGVFGGILAELFPKKAQYEQRRGRSGAGANGDGNGDGEEEDDDDERFKNAGFGGGKKRDVPEDAPAVSADPFEALGLAKEGATAEEVAKAYKKMAIKWHPDKNGQSAESVAMMQTINAARAKCLSALKGDDGDDGGGGGGGGGGRGGGGAGVSDDSSDDDVGGADGPEKARRRAERGQRKQAEEAQKEYTRKRKQERQRMRAEAKHPGGRFRRQQAAHQQQQQSKAAEDGAGGGAGGEGSGGGGGGAGRGGGGGGGGVGEKAARRGNPSNPKKNKSKKDKRDRYRDSGDADEDTATETDTDSEDEGAGGGGTALPAGERKKAKVRAHHARMERTQHEVATAARAGAAIVLFELLQFEFPPLLEVDTDGNTPLHYVARFEPSLVDTVLQVVGSEWKRAVLLKNRFGETPADLLTPVVEEMQAEVAAAADKSDAAQVGLCTRCIQFTHSARKRLVSTLAPIKECTGFELCFQILN